MDLEVDKKQGQSEIGTVRDMAHKLIDHLTVVIGYTEIARQQRKLGHGVCAELAKIEAAAHRAIEMVRQASDRLKILEETK
jgi:hypothetical protein